MKSFTLDYVKDVFAKEGYILCDLEYKNNSKPLQYKCPKGHFGKISLTSWKSGGRCAKCAKNAKMTIEEIREAFVEEGYVLISKEYKNAHSPLEYICPNGHRHYITWSNWNNKKKFRCPKCGFSVVPKIIKDAQKELDFKIEQSIKEKEIKDLEEFISDHKGRKKSEDESSGFDGSETSDEGSQV